MGSEVFGGFDESGAVDLLPESVDGDASGEGVLGIGEPLGEVHAGGDGAGGFEWGEEVWGVALDGVSKLVVVAADANAGVTWGGAITHDHGTADVFEEFVFLVTELFEGLWGFFGFFFGCFELGEVSVRVLFLFGDAFEDFFLFFGQV